MDSLSATLQNTNMSAAFGQQNAILTTDALKQIRNDGSFKAFFETVLKKELLDYVSNPVVTRKRRVPPRQNNGHAEPSFPEISDDL